MDIQDKRVDLEIHVADLDIQVAKADTTVREADNQVYLHLDSRHLATLVDGAGASHEDTFRIVDLDTHRAIADTTYVHLTDSKHHSFFFKTLPNISLYLLHVHRNESMRCKSIPKNSQRLLRESQRKPATDVLPTKVG